MIKNLAEYFIPGQQFYLDKISYNRIDTKDNKQEYNLSCEDVINVSANEENVVVTVTRNLLFTPEGIFELSVSFGAVLTFDENKKKEIKWEDINLAEEFKDNGQFVLVNLMNRMSLLIAEITSSFGQMPIILPPAVAPEINS